MAKKEKESKNTKRTTANGNRCIIKKLIAEDQREYIEGVREWLHDSLRNKGKIVGGPTARAKSRLPVGKPEQREYSDVDARTLLINNKVMFAGTPFVPFSIAREFFIRSEQAQARFGAIKPVLCNKCIEKLENKYAE